MERIAHVASTFAEADDWDVKQCLAMSPNERMQASRIIKDRLYPNSEDIRDCLKDPSRLPTFRKMRRNSSGCFTLTASDFYSSEERL